MYAVLKKQSRHLVYIAFCVWGVVGLLAGFDLYHDLIYHAPWSHILVEMTMTLAAILAAVVLLLGLSDVVADAFKRFELNEAQAQEEISHLENQNSRLMAELSQRILHQFEAWQLTEAEVEIGFLLIKGFSLREIADFRHTSERTVREQARKIYQKAALGGRSELSAIFLQDLIVPSIG